MERFKIYMLALAVLVLGLMAYSNYSLPLNPNDYTPDSFYKGESYGSKEDPKKYYQELNGLQYSESEESDCITTVSYLSETQSIGMDAVYFSDTVLSDKDIKNIASYIGSDGSGLFSGGEKLVMPKEGTTFRNSNISYSTLGSSTKDIEVCVGDSVLVVFSDVKCWWCHMHAPDVTQCTEIIGNSASSVCKSVGRGAIIGMANPTTKVCVYVVSNTETMKNTDKSALFEQVDTGAYFSDGSLNKITQN